MTTAQFIQGAIGDAVFAAPAALVRVLLEWRVNPLARWYFTVGEKARMLMISMLLAVMTGEVARAFPSGVESLHLPVEVMVVGAAFLGQDLAMKLIPRLQQWLSDKFPGPADAASAKPKEGGSRDENK